MIEYLKFGIFVTLTDIPALIVSFDFRVGVEELSMHTV